MSDSSFSDSHGDSACAMNRPLFDQSLRKSSRVTWTSLNGNWLERAVIGRC